MSTKIISLYKQFDTERTLRVEINNKVFLSLKGIKSCLVQNRNQLQTSETSIEWYFGLI